MTELDRVTKSFGDSYNRAKDWTDTKAERQQKMFEVFTKEKSKEVLAQRLVPLEDLGIDEEQNIAELIRDYYPGWRLMGYRDDQLILQEDPSLTKFEHVNKQTGMVYARTFRQGGPILDDEALRANDPNLWNEISVWPEPWYGMFAQAIVQFTNGATFAEAQKYVGEVFEQQGLHKTLTDPNTWSDELMERVKLYMKPGKITVALVAPRQAKPEELE